jgi:hypothetical protein
MVRHYAVKHNVACLNMHTILLFFPTIYLETQLLKINYSAGGIYANVRSASKAPGNS